MPEWIALSRHEHRKLHFLPRAGYAFAGGHHLVPVVMAELGKLLPHYTLSFILQKERYLPVALLGLAESHNLYLHPDGRWLGDYVPAELRGYPFAMGRSGDGGERVLCIDRHALLNPQEGGLALFNDEGELTQAPTQTLDFLRHCERSRQQALAAAAALAEYELLTPWSIEIASGGAAPFRLDGLYRVDEKALNALSAERLAHLRGNGALALAYAQLFSIHQLEQLKRRARFLAERDASGGEGPLDDIDVDDDGELTFDFDN